MLSMHRSSMPAMPVAAVLRPVNIIWIIAASIGSMQRSGRTRALLVHWFVSLDIFSSRRGLCGDMIFGIDIKGFRRENHQRSSSGGRASGEYRKQSTDSPS